MFNQNFIIYFILQYLIKKPNNSSYINKKYDIFLLNIRIPLKMLRKMAIFFNFCNEFDLKNNFFDFPIFRYQSHGEPTLCSNISHIYHHI